MQNPICFTEMTRYSHYRFYENLWQPKICHSLLKNKEKEGIFCHPVDQKCFLRPPHSVTCKMSFHSNPHHVPRVLMLSISM